MVIGFLRDSRLAQERKHTESERERAESERARAESERARADQALAELNRLRMDYENATKALIQRLEELNNGSKPPPEAH